MSASPEAIQRFVNTAVPFVGLTGGMGSGKSTALAALERLGAAVLSSDAVVHELYEGDLSCATRCVARWGAEVAPDGVVDRAAVAGGRLPRSEERKWLEGLLWPLVGARVAAWLEEVRSGASRWGPTPRAAVVEVPLLFEAGLGELYDATIAVVARSRCAGSGLPRAGTRSADERAARQLPRMRRRAKRRSSCENDGTERGSRARSSRRCSTSCR